MRTTNNFLVVLRIIFNTSIENYFFIVLIIIFRCIANLFLGLFKFSYLNSNFALTLGCLTQL